MSTTRLRAFAASVRYTEVLMLQGTPVMGALFAGGVAELASVRGVLFLTASVLLVAHVFLLNDWAGVSADARDPNKSAAVFRARGLADQAAFSFSIVLFAASLVILAVVEPRTLGPAIGVATLGAVYSHPLLNAKSRPVFSSVVHVAGAVLHFLLGYVLFASVDARAFGLASFFALTFTAGHLNQEVRDHEADRASGVQTNAVTFGPRPTFIAGFVLFILAYAMLALLTWKELVAAPVGWLLVGVVPIHATAARFTYVRGLTFESMSRLQATYRLLYVLIGATIVVTALRTELL